MKKLFYKILLLVNALFSFSLLLSYLAAHVNPENFALPALFGLAYPYLLLVNILFALTWAVLLRYEVFIPLIVIAAGFTHHANYIRVIKPTGNKENTIKIVSYNLRFFNFLEKGSGNSEKKILSFLKAQHPDIVMLQELYMNGDPIVKDKAIREALGGDYQSHVKMLGKGRGHSYLGIATYTKYRIIRRGQVIHPGSSSLSIFTDILIGRDTVRVFNNHLQSFRLKKMERSFLDEMTKDDKETFNEFRNLSVSLKKGFIRRAHQAEAVKNQVVKTPYPVIVAGDFNDTPVSYAYRTLQKGLNDSFVRSGYGAGFTYRGNYPANRIDYILHDDSFETRYFEILKVNYSDHYPVVAYIRKRTGKGDS